MDEAAPRFTPKQVTALTDVSTSRLGRWHAQALVVPAYTDESRWLGYKRLYSVPDVLALRILYILRDKQHNIMPRDLLEANTFLKERYDIPWDNLTLYTLNGRVYFERPDSRAIQDAGRVGQIPLPVPLCDVIAPIREKILVYTTRQPSEYGRVERRRGIMGWEPCLARTRIPTSSIWAWHEAGHDDARIKAAYPALGDADVTAAIAYGRLRREQACECHTRSA